MKHYGGGKKEVLIVIGNKRNKLTVCSITRHVRNKEDIINEFRDYIFKNFDEKEALNKYIKEVIYL